MPKPTKVVALYRISEQECVQFVVTIPNDYPDALAEAQVTAVKGVTALLAEAVKLQPDTTSD